MAYTLMAAEFEAWRIKVFCLCRLWPRQVRAYIGYGLYRLWPIQVMATQVMAYTGYGLYRIWPI